MRAFIKQRHGVLDTWRPCSVLSEGDRVVMLCPDTDNELVNCSRSFFDNQVEQGLIILVHSTNQQRLT